jgi:hypothetical protein
MSNLRDAILDSSKITNITHYLAYDLTPEEIKIVEGGK